MKHRKNCAQCKKIKKLMQEQIISVPPFQVVPGQIPEIGSTLKKPLFRIGGVN